ncbi:MAG: hypothetical protein WDN23_04460 [Edaphobacter sp.]
MRLDLPHEPEISRPREIDPAPASAAPPLPVSAVDENLSRLQRPVAGGPAHPPTEPKPALELDEIKRSREPEQRPRRTREGVAVDIRDVRLRPEERQLLGETGRFRVLNIKDVKRTIYQDDERAMRTDLHYLRESGLVSVDSVAPRNDGHWLPQKRIEVVTLTKEGKQLASETNSFASEQKLYHGLVKPREAEHDTQIYRAYLKESERIEKAGGGNLRVELDFEIKSRVQKAIRAARKADPERDMAEIKREVAEQQQLPFVRNKIEIPDARIRYDMDQGARTAFSDVEVVTAAYRPGHMRAKSQAGFRMYASSSDRSRLATIEDEQHMLDWVMDL